MTIDEFVALLVDFHGDLELMVRGHPFTQEEIAEALDLTEPEGAEFVILMKMLSDAGIPGNFFM